MTPEQDRRLHDLQLQCRELELENQEMRASRDALEEALARSADLDDLSPIATFTLDPQGAVAEVNLTGATLIGRDRAQILGVPLPALVQMRDPAPFWSHIQRCSEGLSPVVSELCLCLAWGVDVDVQLTSVPVCDAQGSPRGFRSALIDISARKRADAAREQALQSERRMGNQLERLHRAGIAFSRFQDVQTSSDLTPLLQIIADQARVVADADYAMVTIGDPSDVCGAKVNSGMTPEIIAAIGRPRIGPGILGIIANTG